MPRRPRISLTRLEAEAMAAVWNAGPAPVRVRDVVESINSGRSEPLAYNTVQTVLNILRDKGALTVAKGESRALLYRAKISQTDAARNMVHQLIERLFGGRVEPLLQQLVQDESLSDEQLRELRRWVDDRLRDAPEGRE